MQLASLIQRYGSAGWRHRWKALATAWLVCIAGWVGVSLIPDRYESSVRLYADADVVLSQLLRGIAVDNAAGNQVALLQRTLVSRPNLERVVARTDLDMRVTSLESREELLKKLEREIKISAQTANLFTITYSDQDARLARDVVQALLNLFIEQATTNDRQQMENARAFIAQQIAAYETQLREAERRRAEFRVRYLELLPNDQFGGLTKLEQARAQIQQMTNGLIDLKQRRDMLKQQLDSTSQTLSTAEAAVAAGGRTTTPQTTDPRVAQAEAALTELRLRFTEQHPDVVSARKTLAEAQAGASRRKTELTAEIAQAQAASGAAAQQNVGRVPNPLYEQLRLRLVDAEATIGSVERRLSEEQVEADRLQAMARGAPQLQAESLNLDRDYNVLRKNYEDLLSRREAVQISGAARAGAERVRLEVVDPPTIPTLPTSPNRPLLYSGVLFLGLAAGCGVIALLTMMDRAFYTLGDLRRLGLPVLGGISSADPPARLVLPAAAFGTVLAMLLMTYGAVMVAGPKLMAKLPELLSRMLA
jgi:polysaccharide chain length determinant protein (PEP-CTERM system associated)